MVQAMVYAPEPIDYGDRYHYGDGYHHEVLDQLEDAMLVPRASGVDKLRLLLRTISVVSPPRPCPRRPFRV